jgi:ketosteroid isomerase-like protein
LRQPLAQWIIRALRSARQELLRHAFAGLADGDLRPFEELFDADARWAGVPHGGHEGETAECADRSVIVARLARHHKKGRRFTAEEFIEERDRVAVGVTITDPGWSGPVKVFRVFTFRPGENVVVRMNDCVDESYALQVLAA